MLLSLLAVLFGLLSICFAWLTARKLAWPRDGVAYGKFVGSLAGAAATVPALAALTCAMYAGHVGFTYGLVGFMVIGSLIASVHGEHVGVKRATQIR